VQVLGFCGDKERSVDAWTIGFAVAALVVVVVVVLLVVLLVLARRVAARADAILAALQAADRHTVGLTRLTHTNRLVARVNGAAAAAREAVEGGGR
jgi:hypothetical protein